ncbi:TIGR01777 family oxidoreductase [Flavobacterium sp.]|uniref:TIGR01777 family oxidoreductase n=1 Tax=Flavobacterium sp. TaxID=239 RepID=UPI003C442322
MKKNILITGGTGFVGQNLARLLIEKGFSVSILSRTKKSNQESLFYYCWDIEKGTMDEEAVLYADCIIHLAGENIAGKRWTKARKKAILDSRVVPVKLIKAVLKKYNKKLDAFITASGIGIYGAYNSSQVNIEDSPLANDFLGTVCQQWEAVADEVLPFATRIVKVRTGLVLGNGGFLNKLLPLFQWKLGSVIGSGNQYMPWIHIDDLCAIYLEAVTNEQMNGAYNAAIQDNTTNRVFSKTLAKVVGYKIWLPPVPAFLIRMFLGELAVIILAGQKVSSAKIEQLGFQFQYTDLEATLKDSV